MSNSSDESIAEKDPNNFEFMIAKHNKSLINYVKIVREIDEGIKFNKLKRKIDTGNFRGIDRIESLVERSN